MQISLVMTNWNGKDILKETLPTVLAAASYEKENDCEILLVDDCSSDGSVEFVRENFPLVQVLPLKKNVGSIAAANFGVEKAKHPIVMLLNSDMKLEKDAVCILYRRLSEKNVFAVTPAVYDWKGQFQYGNRGGFFRFGHFSQVEKPVHEVNTETLFACGGAFLFKKVIWEELGGYDNDLFYPYYYEEIDLSYRALKRGYRIIYEPKAKVYHKIQGSISKDRHFEKIRIISGRNNYLFTWKNITDGKKVLAMFFFVPLFLLRDLFRLRFRFWKCFFQALPFLPKAMIKRKQEKPFFRLTDEEIFDQVKGDHA